MNVLVTGGIGGVGSHLVEELIKQGHIVSILDNFSRSLESEYNYKEMTKNLNKSSFKGRANRISRRDITNYRDVEDSVKDMDLVFHLAALPSHRLALKDPLAYANVDIIGTVNVLEAVRNLKQSTKVLFASSNKVYGHTQPPFQESMPTYPDGPYGLAKKQSEEWCELYNKFYGVSVVIVRLHHIIGPRMQPDLALSIFAEEAINNKEITVHGIFDTNGEFTSCAAAFTNVYDAVKGMIKAIEYNSNCEIFNIGASTETSVETLANLAIIGVNSTSKVVKKQMYPHESLHHAANPTKAKLLLGWEATTSINESVNQYLDWRKARGDRPQAKYDD